MLLKGKFLDHKLNSITRTHSVHASHSSQLLLLGRLSVRRLFSLDEFLQLDGEVEPRVARNTVAALLSVRWKTCAFLLLNPIFELENQLLYGPEAHSLSVLKNGTF